MTSPRSNNTRSNNPRSNRPMFRRLVRRLIFANRGRLFVILLALSAGAAVSAALLNLQTDAKRRINSEFQLFGPNVVITPKQSNNIPASTLDESILSQIRMAHAPSNQRVNSTAYLYLLADVSSSGHPTKTRMVVAGIHSGSNETPGLPEGVGVAPPEKQLCFIGQKAADQMHVTVGDHVTLHTELSEESCKVSLIVPHGDADDSQIFPHLDVAQRISGLVGRISLVQITVRGTPDQIDSYVMDLRSRIPDADVRPLRQFTEAQSKIYSRISGLLNAATAIILVLTALCVMAAMTNIAAERKRDVGMMKAIGGSARSILNLFLTEAALLGLAGGLIGAAAGIALSIMLGKAVFGVAAAPRLIVYPISVALTVIVAILGAYPLRRLANVRPATVFRGEA